MGLSEVVCIFGAVHTHIADAQEPLRAQNLPPPDTLNVLVFLCNMLCLVLLRVC